MHDLLDWFRLEEAFSIITLACILTFVGGRMTSLPFVERRAAWISGAAFLLYAGAGLYVWGVADQTEVVLIAMRALLAAALAFGIGTIVFSLVNAIQARIEAWQVARKPIPQPHETQETVVEELPPPPEPKEPPPPSPTREELAAQALKKYEDRLDVIENSKLDETAARSARERAQQQYTKDLDSVMT